MKASEYNDIITKLSNPDTVSDGLCDLSERLKADELAFSKLNDSVNNLRDTNAKLALRITNTVDDSNKQPEKTNDDIFNELFTSQFNKEA